MQFSCLARASGRAVAILAAAATVTATVVAAPVLVVDFEDQTAGAKALATAVRPTTNVGITDALPIANANPGPIATVVAPYASSPSLAAPGTGKFVRFMDYHTASGSGLEWDFVTAANQQASAVKVSFRFATTRPMAAGAGFARLSVVRYAGTTSLTTNSGANRPFLVSLAGDGTFRLELAGAAAQATTFDTGVAHTATIFANDHETEALTITGPDGTERSLGPDSVMLFLNNQLVGSGPFDSTTQSIYGTDANLGRFGLSTLTTEGNIDFLFDDITVDVLRSGVPGPVEPTVPTGFGRGTGDNSLVELDPDVLLHDPVAYADGALEAVANRWLVRDGGPKLTVASGAVRYDFVGQSSSGHYARNFVAGQTVWRVPATGQLGPVVHYAATLRVATLPTSTTGSGLLGLQSSTSSSTLRGTLWVRAATSPGFFQVGLAPENSSTGVQWLARDLAPNTDYRLAVRFDLTTNAGSLWLDPANAEAAADLTIVGSASVLTGTNGLAARFTSSSSMGVLTVDNLRVALSLTGVLASNAIPQPPAEILRDSTSVSVLGEGFDAYFSGNALLGLLRHQGELWLAADGGGWQVPGGAPVYPLEDSRVVGSLHGRMQSHGELVTIHPSPGRLTLLLQNNRTDVTIAYRVPLFLPRLGSLRLADGTAPTLPATATGAPASDVVVTSTTGRTLRIVGATSLAPAAGGSAQEVLVAVPPRGVASLVFSFESFSVDSPRPWQVFQRSEHRRGPVRIAGRAPTGTATVTIELAAAAAEFGGLLAMPKAVLPVGEQTLGAPAAGGLFDLALTLPAGGWYQATIHAKDAAGAVLATQAVAPIGVGEVFVAAGQSNSTNSGTDRMKPTTGLVAAFSGGHWQPGLDPLPGNHDTTSKGSYYVPLGDLLATQLGVPIAFASTGHGGTSVEMWQKNTPHAFVDFDDSVRQGLYSWTLFRLRQLGINGFRAVLWHQGESDSTKTVGVVRTPEQTYYDKKVALITGLRSEAGWNLPWFSATGTRWPLIHDGDPEIQRAVARLVADGVVRAGAVSDSLGLEDREPAVDETSSRVHFNREGLIEHAKLWRPLVGDFVEGLSAGAGALDTDQAGAPDFWERQQGLDPANPTDDILDPDGDGVPNYLEFLWGTNPVLRGLPPVARPLPAPAGAEFVLEVPGLAGRTYLLSYRPELGRGEWAEVARAQPTAAGTVRLVAPAAAARGFYQLAVRNE